MEFLENYLQTIQLFIEEAKKGPRDSNSIKRCQKILTKYGSQCIQKQCEFFWSECSELHAALKEFSESKDTPMATHVCQMLEHLYEISEGTGAPQGLRSSLLHHKKRLDKNHNMRLWKQVMWFRPSWVVLFGRPIRQHAL